MADQPEMLSVAHRLFACGARLGAAQILFNAASQRQAAEVANLTQQTPFGRLPLRMRPEPHLTAANDHPEASSCG